MSTKSIRPARKASRGRVIKIESPAPVRHDLRVLRALRGITRAVSLYSRKLYTRQRITSPQLVCLLVIAEEQSITASEIARRVHLSPSTMVGILDRLEANGLVVRQRNRRDRRTVSITLSRAGRAMLRKAPSPLQDGLAAALSALPETEQATIADSLERVVELMGVESLTFDREKTGLEAERMMPT